MNQGIVADPARTAALLVGVEQYPEEDWNHLKGVAKDVRKFAGWLIECGVPPDRVLLHTSEESPAGPLRATVNGNEVVVKALDAKFETIRSSFFDTVKQWGDDGKLDLLIVYWAGHGYLDDDLKRWLDCADSRHKDRRSFPFDSILAVTRCLPYPALTAAFIDACAIDLVLLEPDARPGSVKFQRGTPNPNARQFVLFSARESQFAQNQRGDDPDSFAASLFKALAQPDAAWPPNLHRIAQQIKAHFTTLRATGKTDQIPVFATVSWDGDVEDSDLCNLAVARRTSRLVRLATPAELAARRAYLNAVCEDFDKRRSASLHRAVWEDMAARRRAEPGGLLTPSASGVAAAVCDLPDLDLALATAVGAARLPWDTVDLEDKRNYARVEDAFAQHKRRLLILGEPGSGKSTSLLRLARQALDTAAAVPDSPVPLVVNLSEYRPKRLPEAHQDSPAGEAVPVPEGDLERWLAERMAKYQMPFAEARRWLSEGRVAVFFDGLDEVKLEFRNEVVRLLNTTFLKDHPHIPVAVCSRANEYRQMQGKQESTLHLAGGVELRPLTQEQIREYLKAADAEALAGRLLQDEDLKQLAQNPLTLSMMTLAYAGSPASALPGGTSLSARRQALMEAFVDRMLQRKERRDRRLPYVEMGYNDVPQREYRYPPAAVKRYLGWLAVQLSVRMRTAFSPSRCYVFVAEKPLATGSQQFDTPIAVGMHAGWFLLGLLASAVIVASLRPWVSGAGVTAAIVLGVGSFVTAFGACLPRVKEWSVLAVAIGGVGLLGHALASILPWGWGPYVAASMMFVVALGILFAVSRDYATAPTTIGGAFLASYVAGHFAFWPFGYGWTLSGCLVLFQAIAAVVTDWWQSKRGGWSVLRGLVGGLLLVVFPLILFAGVWLVSLSVSHSYLAVVVGVLFLFLLTCDPDMGTIALGLTIVASVGQLAGGISGGTLGLCAFLLLLVPLLVIGRGAPELPAKTKLRLVLQVVRSEFTKEAPIRWLHGLLSWPVRTFNWLAEPLLDLVIRLVLAGAGRRPLSWRRFVGYAQEALLLKWVGPDLEFSHRLVRDYFALLDRVPELVDPDPVRRVAAVQMLGYHGESAIDTLGECLGDSDLGVRVAAVESIGRIASPRAMPHLEAATKDRHDAIRRAAVGAFRDRSTADREALERWLCEDSEVSILFHWLLVIVGADQFLHPGPASQAAAEAYYLLGRPIHSQCTRFFADSTNPNEYRRGVWYLAWGRFDLPPRDPDQATIEERRRLIHEELEKALAHFDQAIRAAAARALGLVDEPTTRALLERALADRESAVRAAAAEGLGYLGARESRYALERALADREGDVCAAAAIALAKLGDPAALPAMRRALAIAKDWRMPLLIDPDDSAWARIEHAIATLENFPRR